MKFRSILATALLLVTPAAQAQVFDNHVHLWNGEQSLREYEEQIKADCKTVTGFGGMWFGGPNQALAGQPVRIRASNDALLALAARHSEMLPIATVHPYDGAAALAELQRVAGLGIRVIKIHPHTQLFDAADPRVLALVRRAGELSVIVMMDNANILPGDSEKLFNLALRAPKTKFLFAHLGGMNFRFWNVLKLARTAEGLFGDNIYFDISATVTLAAGSPIADEFVWTIRNVGIDHVLLGSDYPQFSLARTLNALDRLHLTAAEKAAITHGNAQTLLNLKHSFFNHGGDWQSRI
ncbi:amidohydrolase family protein [Sphingomonas sp. SUN019]|uniref:amidohydrolase family protein n=1 Tax=Sphingomonas sp. SUN019 TaxID=2937788 RepID=UPI0021645DCB|nr:amidohydrolase family protein [Sphingomonas sp. SUN019]UVO49474.1 amidohydrolase family protein [Sphingomonas sp. SUN019]